MPTLTLQHIRDIHRYSWISKIYDNSISAPPQQQQQLQLQLLYKPVIIYVVHLMYLTNLRLDYKDVLWSFVYVTVTQHCVVCQVLSKEGT